jgi:hypothetical protein
MTVSKTGCAAWKRNIASYGDSMSQYSNVFLLGPDTAVGGTRISMRVVIELESPGQGHRLGPKNSFVKAFAVQWTKIGLSKTREDMRCIEIGGSEYLNERVLRPFCSSPCRALMFRYGC